jgi:protease-4
MFSLLPGIPGADDLRSLVRKVDTARHHGVPDGCVLELDLLSAPPEASGFDPMAHHRWQRQAAGPAGGCRGDSPGR